MKITATSQNFTGYKNIITSNLHGSNGDLSFITAQLDNVGSPDLDEYKKIKKLIGHSSSADKDVITMIKSQVYGAKPILYFDVLPLMNGNDLERLGACATDKQSMSEYKSLEKLSMKIYTLMASLTKRMMNENFHHRDEGFKEVIKQFMSVMTVFTRNNDAAYDVLDFSLRKNETCKKAAEIINNTIVKSLKSYF